MPVIGFVAGTMKQAARFLENVRKGLAEYGYIEDQNYRLDIRESNFQVEREPIFYRQFVDQKVTLIITATTLGVQNARAATQSIPIVFTIGSDPVENGFVASLNKPGGNITGIYNLGLALSGKRLSRYGSLDTFGLVRTGRWKSAESADRYNHTIASPEARRSDLLPVKKRKTNSAF